MHSPLPPPPPAAAPSKTLPSGVISFPWPWRARLSASLHRITSVIAKGGAHLAVALAAVELALVDGAVVARHLACQCGAQATATPASRPGWRARGVDMRAWRRCTAAVGLAVADCAKVDVVLLSLSSRGVFPLVLHRCISLLL